MKALILCLLSYLLLAAPGQKIPDEMYQKWYHSHEESDSDVKVYRPETYDFPPTRAREAIEFRKDGTFSEFRTSPADGWIEHKGKFVKKKGSKYLVTIEEPTSETYIYEVLTLTDSILKVNITSKK
ncbi:hypothetical protein RCC89_15380 [Cytophagaceae bacterium ABcell3]|nr:hypothetical protein RCC89_15380 [Cytophagaceae bacterium ABcell3]